MGAPLVITPKKLVPVPYLNMINGAAVAVILGDTDLQTPYTLRIPPHVILHHALDNILPIPTYFDNEAAFRTTYTSFLDSLESEIGIHTGIKIKLFQCCKTYSFTLYSENNRLLVKFFDPGVNRLLVYRYLENFIIKYEQIRSFEEIGTTLDVLKNKLSNTQLD